MKISDLTYPPINIDEEDARIVGSIGVQSATFVARVKMGVHTWMVDGSIEYIGTDAEDISIKVVNVSCETIRGLVVAGGNVKGFILNKIRPLINKESLEHARAVAAVNAYTASLLFLKHSIGLINKVDEAVLARVMAPIRKDLERHHIIPLEYKECDGCSAYYPADSICPKCGYCYLHHCDGEDCEGHED
jgi:hypothetical protein